MNFSKALMASALTLGMASAASAAPVSFSFYGNGVKADPNIGERQASYSFLEGGVALTVTAGQYQVSNRQDGLGVGRSSGEAGEINSDLINNGLDKLYFNFDKQVKLTNLTMKLWENGTSLVPLDQFSLTYNGVTTNHKLNNGVFNFSTLGYTSGFYITGIGGGTSFRVSGMTVDPKAPEVPVPAAAWLFGSALVGLAGMRRRA